MKKTFLSNHDTAQEAYDAQSMQAETLKAMGDVKRYGISVERAHDGTYNVYLIDRKG